MLKAVRVAVLALVLATSGCAATTLPDVEAEGCPDSVITWMTHSDDGLEEADGVDAEGLLAEGQEADCTFESATSVAAVIVAPGDDAVDLFDAADSRWAGEANFTLASSGFDRGGAFSTYTNDPFDTIVVVTRLAGDIITDSFGMSPDAQVIVVRKTTR